MSSPTPPPPLPPPPSQVPPPPPAETKSWFRRHKFLTAIIAVVALIVVGNLLSPGDDDDPVVAEADTSQEDANQTEESADEDDAAEAAEPEVAQADADASDADEPAEDAPAAETEDAPVAETEDADEPSADDTPAAEEEEAPGSPGIGDAVRDGQFEFVVLDVETGLSSVGEGFTQEEARGQFVVVTLSITTIGDSSQTFLDGNQALIDDQGREHSSDSATLWIDDGIFIEEINPGITIEGILAFDIPADSEPVQMKLHDSMFSGGVLVDLR